MENMYLFDRLSNDSLKILLHLCDSQT